MAKEHYYRVYKYLLVHQQMQLLPCKCFPDATPSQQEFFQMNLYLICLSNVNLQSFEIVSTYPTCPEKALKTNVRLAAANDNVNLNDENSMFNGDSGTVLRVLLAFNSVIFRKQSPLIQLNLLFISIKMVLSAIILKFPTKSCQSWNNKCLWKTQLLFNNFSPVEIVYLTMGEKLLDRYLLYYYL